VNILAAERLMQQSPKVYATFLLWLISELFERLPEVGDPEKPKLVFFFDEAHLLFADIPKALATKIEQVVRLIRSKGVGIYFVSQNPLDIPDVVLGQLGNRVQHALRAFTPRDQKAVAAAAQTFRQNPKLDVATVLTELAVGEALVSMLEDDGKPGIVARARILPPRSQIGPIPPTSASRLSVPQLSPVITSRTSIGSRLMRRCSSAARSRQPQSTHLRPNLARLFRRRRRNHSSGRSSRRRWDRAAAATTAWRQRSQKVLPGRSAANSAGRSSAVCWAGYLAEQRPGAALSTRFAGRELVSCRGSYHLLCVSSDDSAPVKTGGGDVISFFPARSPSFRPFSRPPLLSSRLDGDGITDFDLAARLRGPVT
jgi:hypothetical protein